MNARTTLAFSLALTLGLALASCAQQKKPDAAEGSTTTPVSRLDQGWWKGRFDAANARAQLGGVDLVFLGDSITQGWEEAGREPWERYYAPRHPFNLGFSGDRTEHLLWRLQHGNVDGIDPKVAVLLIGTNDSNGDEHTAQEIAAGIEADVRELRERLPRTRILLLGIFPRGETPNPQRDKIAEANRLASALDDGQWVRFVDIGPRFLLPDGKISKEIMPDFLHLSTAGYEIWASAIEPPLAELFAQR